LEFEWDEDKAAANLRDHGIAFHEAIPAFRDTFAVERIDDREDYGEERVNLIGMCARQSDRHVRGWVSGWPPAQCR
jgi:uncharacterized DUF497 family protein